jgi:hypothetical protein
MPPKEKKDKEKEGAGVTEKCGGCPKAVTDNKKGIQCEICEKWYHIKCQDISEESYKALKEIHTAHWYCKI